MSGAPTVAPGLVIAQRYRLEELVPNRSLKPIPGRGASRVGQLWRARDDILARTVAVLIVEDDDPVAARVLAGARAVAALTNPAMARVYDAGEADGMTYVVVEFFGGGSLEQQLVSGPLEPSAAVDLVAGVASAIADAHDIGLYDMTPSPGRVLFTSSGIPRLAGVALAGDPPDDAVRTDTLALAHLLYAALTGRWPGDPAMCALPSAPYTEGHLCAPRQVRGGVPREVDLVVARTLGLEHFRHSLVPITSPRAFATALEPLRSATEDGHPYETIDTAPLSLGDLRSDPTRRRRWWWPARRGGRAGVIAGAIVLAVAIGGLFWPGQTIYPSFVTHPNAKPTDTPTSTTTTAAATKPLPIASIKEFDPYGDHTDPHVTEAPRAIDGDVGTAWHTQTFTSAKLGNMKPGVGLLVDLGSDKTVSAVRLRLIGSGTTITLLESDSPPAGIAQMTAVVDKAGLGETATLQLPKPTSGRYWLVWLTKLPPGNGAFAGGVAEVTFES